MLAGIAGGAYAVWQQVRHHVLASSEYLVDPQQIAITPPPRWIHADIRAEAVREASMDGPLSLLDRELTVRVASAFAAHPWVAQVERVSKHYPAGLDVELVYRKPVAMVEVDDGTGVLPIDADAVVLPTSDFTAADAEAYPRIGEIHTTPSGPVGTRWGDDSVLGAAQIATALSEDWKSLGLSRIIPIGKKPGRTGTEPVFALVTTAGTQIYWGRAPSTKLPGELPVGEKLAVLKRHAAQNDGKLDMPDGENLLIREDGALVAQPRPAVTPLPKEDQ